MTTIEELSASETALLARQVLLGTGDRLTGSRLVYRALMLDPYEPVALRWLADLLHDLGQERLSLAVLEFGLAEPSPLGQKERDELERQLRRLQSIFGFGREGPGEEEYLRVLGGREPDRLERSYRAGLAALGRECGFLEAAEPSGAETAEPPACRLTASYHQWLKQERIDLTAG